MLWFLKFQQGPNGEVITSAKLGDIVYHSWKCDEIPGWWHFYIQKPEKILPLNKDWHLGIKDLYGILVHDCYAGSELADKFSILDPTG